MTNTGLTPEQRECRLITATERYLAGKISAAQFREEKARYQFDYRLGALALAQRKP